MIALCYNLYALLNNGSLPGLKFPKSLAEMEKQEANVAIGKYIAKFKQSVTLYDMSY